VDLVRLAERIADHRREVGPSCALLVGISGIDGSGKGFLTARLAPHLEARALKVASINVDGWLNLPARRFSPDRPASHFYHHALRLEELFSQLVLPLRDHRRVDLVAEFAEETATTYRPHRYHWEGVDVVLLEGIYLYKRAYRPYFDLAGWVDCSFETALARALARGQEGLPPEAARRAYETIYFPAQRLHFVLDDPRGTADWLVQNDPRLAGEGEEAGVAGSRGPVDV